MREPTIIEKTLTKNDVAETGSNQSGPYVGTPNTIPEFFPSLDTDEDTPFVTMDFKDGRGKVYTFHLRYWKAKREFHLTHLTAFYREHDVKSGDALMLRRDPDGSLHVAVRSAGEYATGRVVRKSGAWRVMERYEPDPDEEYSKGLPEGAKRRIEVNRYERSQTNRRQCLVIHGYDCLVCGINFEDKYGEIGHDFIEVHHVAPLAELDSSYEVDVAQDLLPVCPNCHRMLHRRNPPLTVEELRRRYR